MKNHGADTDYLMRKYKIEGELLDFSSNINPEFPRGLEEKIITCIPSMKSYPDIEYRKLRDIIAGELGHSLCGDDIVVGNGATEIIFSLAKVLDGPFAVVNPTFSEYERAVRINGKEILHIYMDEDRDDYIEKGLTDDVKVLFLCNPNNPDGKLRDIGKTVEICRRKNIVLVVDETFIEFCEEHERYTALAYSYENIVVIRAATKFYGLPGLRFGYAACRNRRITDMIWDIKEPWSVNSIAENIAEFLFKSRDFKKETKKNYRYEREFLCRELKKIKKLKVYDSDSAFMLIKIKDDTMDASHLKEKLILDYNIVIRDAGNFKGLDSSFFRIAVKDRDSNERIASALKEIFI